MKKNKLKIVGIVIAVVVVLIVGVISYASSKLNPEEIRKMAISQTQVVFPNSAVELESVNIKWGLNFKIELKKFSLKTTSNEGAPVEMAYVDSLDVKIPLWAIITNGGVIEIQLDRPQVNYQEFSKGNNWTQAIGDEQRIEPTKVVETNSKERDEDNGPNPAIAILAKSKVNVRLSDVLIKYSLKDKSSGQITVSKFLIKGLSLEDSTAFEVATDAKFVMADSSAISFAALAIGEINIAELINKGEVSSLVIVKLNNIKKTDLNIRIPEITTHLNLLIEKKGKVSGKLETSFESNNKVSANFVMEKDIEVSNIKINIILKDVANILGLDRTIDLSKSILEASGLVFINEDKKINANLKFSISPGLGVTVDGVSTTTSMSGSYKGQDIHVQSSTNLFNGSADIVVDGKYDLNQEFDLHKLNPFKINVIAKKLNIPEKFIQEKLWGKNAPARKVEVAKNEEPKKDSFPLIIPPGTINISWSEVVIANENFSGVGKINLSTKELELESLKFNFSKGSGSLKQTLKFGKLSNISNFDFNIKALNLNSFKGFLPPFVDGFEGTFSGSVNGQATMYNSDQLPTFNINASLEAVNGEVKNINLKDFVGPLVAGIPLLSTVAKDKDLDIDGKFESLTFQGNFTESIYKINNVKLVSKNKRVELFGSGVLVPNIDKNASIMEVTFIDNGKIGERVKVNFGSRELPMRLTGPGFLLKPDIGYTLGKIGKKAVEIKGKETLKKVLEKNIDKVVPEKAKEKVKGILDGFLKKR